MCSWDYRYCSEAIVLFTQWNSNQQYPHWLLNIPSDTQLLATVSDSLVHMLLSVLVSVYQMTAALWFRHIFINQIACKISRFYHSKGSTSCQRWSVCPWVTMLYRACDVLQSLSRKKSLRTRLALTIVMHLSEFLHIHLWEQSAEEGNEGGGGGNRHTLLYWLSVLSFFWTEMVRDQNL